MSKTLRDDLVARSGGIDRLDRALTVSEVLSALNVSKSWLYSIRGRAVVGDGFQLGRSRRYLESTIQAVLANGRSAA